MVLFGGVVHAQTNAMPQTDSFYNKKDTLSKVTYGVKVGANFSQLQGADIFTKGYTPGVAGGLFVASTRKKWGIAAEGMVSTAKYNLQTIPSDSLKISYFNIFYADVAVLVEFEVVPKIWIQVGPEISLLMSVSKSPSGGLDPGNYFQSRNFAGAGGVEAQVLKHFNVGGRYLYGFTDIKSQIAPLSNSAWMTSAIHVYVGYRFK